MRKRPVPNDRALFNELLRTDFLLFFRMVFQTLVPGEVFLDNWHIKAIVYQLMRVRDGTTQRLILNQPPRSLKSLIVSVAWPTWLLGHDPTLRIIGASYSGPLAAEFHRQFRLVMESDWYRELFPATRAAKDTDIEFVTTAQGGRLAVSVGGTLTGRGADLIIIDDPMKAEEAASEAARKRVIDWFTGTLFSRLNDKERGAIILVQQRLHEDDLSGHLLAHGGWDSLILPAIAIEDEVIPLSDGTLHFRRKDDILHAGRDTRETLEATQQQIGSLPFAAQYQQTPVPLQGNLIRRTWFVPYDHLPEVDNRRIVQSWDVALTIGDRNDYSVCTTWLVIKRDYYLVDVVRERLDYPALRRWIAALARIHKASAVLVEDAGPGQALLQEFQKNLPDGMTVRPIGIVPKGSKAERMATQAAKIEAGHVHIPRNAAWLDIFLHELLAFPNGRYDDQVDSVSQFLLWISTRGRRGHRRIAGGYAIPLGDPEPPWGRY